MIAAICHQRYKDNRIFTIEVKMDATEFLNTVESFIRKRSMYPTEFGSKVMNDGSFVFDLRSGRSVTLKTQAKVLTYIEADAEDQAA